MLKLSTSLFWLFVCLPQHKLANRNMMFLITMWFISFYCSPLYLTSAQWASKSQPKINITIVVAVLLAIHLLGALINTSIGAETLLHRSGPAQAQLVWLSLIIDFSKPAHPFFRPSVQNSGFCSANAQLPRPSLNPHSSCSHPPSPLIQWWTDPALG